MNWRRSGAPVRVLEPRALDRAPPAHPPEFLAPDIEGHGSTLLRMLGRRSIDL
jgi:hypothetical protein